MPKATFTAAGFRRGLRAGLPFLPGIAAFAVAFGILAAQVGITPGLAGLMSATVYAGTAQMLALHSWDSGGLLALAGAVFAMNTRYVLFGAALRPWLRGLPAWTVYPSLFFLVDPNWVAAMQEQREGRRDAGFFVGMGVTMFAMWICASVAGAALGSSLDPVRLGLDFFFIAIFLCLAIGLWRGPVDVIPAAVGGLAAVAVGWAGLGGSAVFVGAMAGSLAGAFAPRVRNGR